MSKRRMKNTLDIINDLAKDYVIDFSYADTQEEIKDYSEYIGKIPDNVPKKLLTDMLLEKVACFNALTDSVKVLKETRTLLTSLQRSGCLRTKEQENCKELNTKIKELLRL